MKAPSDSLNQTTRRSRSLPLEVNAGVTMWPRIPVAGCHQALPDHDSRVVESEYRPGFDRGQTALFFEATLQPAQRDRLINQVPTALIARVWQSKGDPNGQANPADSPQKKAATVHPMQTFPTEVASTAFRSTDASSVREFHGRFQTHGRGVRATGTSVGHVNADVSDKSQKPRIHGLVTSSWQPQPFGFQP